MVNQVSSSVKTPRQKLFRLRLDIATYSSEFYIVNVYCQLRVIAASHMRKYSAFVQFSSVEMQTVSVIARTFSSDRFSFYRGIFSNFWSGNVIKTTWTVFIKMLVWLHFDSALFYFMVDYAGSEFRLTSVSSVFSSYFAFVCKNKYFFTSRWSIFYNALKSQKLFH